MRHQLMPRFQNILQAARSLVSRLDARCPWNGSAPKLQKMDVVVLSAQ